MTAGSVDDLGALAHQEIASSKDDRGSARCFAFELHKTYRHAVTLRSLLSFRIVLLSAHKGLHVRWLDQSNIMAGRAI
jgi:hypothetical protein